MDIKKFAPWNWFKKEDQSQTVPVTNSRGNDQVRPHWGIELDRMFDRFFTDFRRPYAGGAGMLEGMSSNLLKPSLDLGATEENYTISVEIPGVDKTDVSLEVAQDTLVIRGEKKQERQNRDKHYYCLERSYGAFQRTLSLPADAVRDEIRADFKNGVLNIVIPRQKSLSDPGRQIKIRYA